MPAGARRTSTARNPGGVPAGPCNPWFTPRSTYAPPRPVRATNVHTRSFYTRNPTMTKSFRKAFADLFSRGRRVTAPRTRRAGLNLESLEDRCVPAVINVNSLADILNPGPGVVTLRSAIQQADTGTDTTQHHQPDRRRRLQDHAARHAGRDGQRRRRVRHHSQRRQPDHRQHQRRPGRRRRQPPVARLRRQPRRPGQSRHRNSWSRCRASRSPTA